LKQILKLGLKQTPETGLKLKQAVSGFVSSATCCSAARYGAFETKKHVCAHTPHTPVGCASLKASRTGPECACARAVSGSACAHPGMPCVCEVPKCAAVPLHGRHAVGDAAYALVDFTDVERVLNHSWHVVPGYSTCYAYCEIGGKQISMHRFILELPRGDNRTNDVDHVNGNGLDNRRHNIRVCTRSQNKRNKHRICGLSGFKGVTFEKGGGKHYSKPWRAYTKSNGVKHWLGYFATREEAAAAYDSAALQEHGEFARTNASIKANPVQTPRMVPADREKMLAYQRRWRASKSI